MNRCRLIKSVLVVCICGVLTGCGLHFLSTPAPTPANGQGVKYPPDRFLEGVGQANSRERAEEQAYIAIAAALRARVMVHGRDRESFVTRDGGSGARSTHRIDMDRWVEVSPDSEDVRIVETWRDEKTGTHFARAVMNLDKAGANLREHIRELDREIIHHVKQSRGQGRLNGSLQHIKHLHKAIRALGLRKTHIADLWVIKPTAAHWNAPYEIPKLRSELSRLLAERLVIAVEVMGDEAELVRRAVIEGLVREGLPVTADRLELPQQASRLQTDGGEVGGGPALVVRGKVEVWPAVIPDPVFTFARWCADFAVVEMNTHRVIGALSRSGKEGHLTFDDAKRRALSAMQPILAAAIAEAVADYIYGKRTEHDAEMHAAICIDRQIPAQRLHAPVLRPLAF